MAKSRTAFRETLNSDERFSRIFDLIKLSTIRRLKANMADPAAENPDTSANTTIAIGRTTRLD